MLPPPPHSPHTLSVLISKYMTSFAQHPDPPFTVRSFHQFLSTVREMEQHSNQAPVLCPVFETDLNKPNMGYNLCLQAMPLYITSAFLYSTCLLLLCCRWWQIHLTLNNGAFRNAHYDRRLPVVKAIYFRKTTFLLISTVPLCQVVSESSGLVPPWRRF